MLLAYKESRTFMRIQLVSEYRSLVGFVKSI